MPDETDEADDGTEYVLSPTDEEIGAAGLRILAALRLHDPQAEDELTTNTGLERGLVALACKRLEREGRVTIAGHASERMYWLKK